MQQYPHVYHASAVTAADPGAPVQIASPGLDGFSTTPPPEFGGPEGRWSPETLLVASVVDCFVLTFQAIARASKFEWVELSCEGDGVLDRVDRVTRFTRFDLRARLQVPGSADPETADKLLHKAESVCLVTASLNSEVVLRTEIVSS